VIFNPFILVSFSWVLRPALSGLNLYLKTQDLKYKPGLFSWRYYDFIITEKVLEQL